MSNIKLCTVLAALAIMAACAEKGTAPENGSGNSSASIRFDNWKLNANKVTFRVISENVISAAFFIAEDKVYTEPLSAEDAFDNGEEITANSSVDLFKSLKWETSYTVYIAAYTNDKKYISDSKKIKVTSETNYSFEAPANTYIVPDAGFYGFETKKVDGSLISATRVDWLWATVPYALAKEQNLIYDVMLEDGLVTFRTTGEEGNVVIAGLNDEDEVVWTWLIWCTDYPQTYQINENSYFLDRAIGAYSANRSEGKEAWHNILYQFGRISPFFGGFADETEAFSEARQWTVVNPALSDRFYWTVDNGQKGSRLEADKNPMTFYTGKDKGKDGVWFSWSQAGEYKDFLYSSWYGVKQEDGSYKRTKTNYDPCPAGYIIPLASDWAASTDEFQSRLNLYGTEINPLGWDYTYNGQVSWFPCGNANREDISGKLIRGYVGTTMLWHSSLYDLGPINGLPKGQEDQLNPARWAFNLAGDAQCFLDCPSNPSFAIGVRCMKIRDTDK